MSEFQDSKELNYHNKKFKFFFILLTLLFIFTPLTCANEYVSNVQEDLPWEYNFKQNIMGESILEITFNNYTDDQISYMQGQIRFKNNLGESLTDWIKIYLDFTINSKGSETIEIKIREKLLFLEAVKLLDRDIDTLIKDIKFIDFRYTYIRFENFTTLQQEELYPDLNRKNEYPTFFKDIDKPFINPRKVIEKYKNKYSCISSIPQNDISINILTASSTLQLMYLYNSNYIFSDPAIKKKSLYVIIKRNEMETKIKNITDYVAGVGFPSINIINLTGGREVFVIYGVNPGYFIIDDKDLLLSLPESIAVKAFEKNNSIMIQSQKRLKKTLFKEDIIKVEYDNYQKVLDLGFMYTQVDNRLLSSYQIEKHKWDKEKEQFELIERNDLPTVINIIENFIKHIKDGNFDKALEYLSPNFQKSLDNKGENLKVYLEKKYPGLLNSQDYFYIGNLKIVGIEDRNIYKFSTIDFDLKLFERNINILDPISYDYQEQWSNMDKDLINDMKIIDNISRSKVNSIKELIYK
jgi:translation initiation factor 1 (eIF-1/SUI1)